MANTNAYQHSTNRIPLILVVTALLAGGMYGAKKIADYQVARQRAKLPWYEMVVDGSQLSLEMSQVGYTIKRIPIATMTAPTISLLKDGNNLVIAKGEKQYRHRFATLGGNILFSPKYQSVLFLDELQVRAKTPDGTIHTKYALFKWNEKGGFKAITSPFSHISQLGLSQDEEAVIGCFSDSGIKSGLGQFIYTQKDNRLQILGIPQVLGNTDAALDPLQLLIGVADQDEHNKPFRRVVRYDLTTGKSSPIYTNPFIRQTIAFDHSIWCLLDREGKPEVIRLNQALDKVEQQIPVKVPYQEAK